MFLTLTLKLFDGAQGSTPEIKKRLEPSLIDD
jgi:hypothetical protein